MPIIFTCKNFLALTGVAQLVGHCPAKQKVVDLIPSQGTCLGYGFGPQVGMHKRGNQCFSPSFPLSLKVNKYNLKKILVTSILNSWGKIMNILLLLR